eukprot:scaffold72906_cov13-Tisochrysis_lutea.AAC.1
MTVHIYLPKPHKAQVHLSIPQAANKKVYTKAARIPPYPPPHHHHTLGIGATPSLAKFQAFRSTS